MRLRSTGRWGLRNERRFSNTGSIDTEFMKKNEITLFLAAVVSHVFWGFSFLGTKSALNVVNDDLYLLLAKEFAKDLAVKIEADRQAAERQAREDADREAAEAAKKEQEGVERYEK